MYIYSNNRQPVKMSEKYKFFINGQEYLIDTIVTISQILEYFDYGKMFFVLECNGHICIKESWDSNYVKNMDKIEVITIMGGG